MGGSADGQTLQRLLRPDSKTRGVLTLVAIALGVVVATALAMWFARPFFNMAHPNTGHDFLLLYASASVMRAHQNPYVAALFIKAAQQQAGLPYLYIVDPTGTLNQPFVYPPLFAWLIIPFTFLAPLRALMVWRALSIISVGVGFYGLTAPWAKQEAHTFFANRLFRVVSSMLVAISPLTIYCIYWGNPVALVVGAMGLWVWALSVDTRRGDIIAGALMTVALLKPQLAAPLAVCSIVTLTAGPGGAVAWARIRRVALSWGCASIGLLALDMVVTGPMLLVSWVVSVRGLTSLVYQQMDMPSLMGIVRSGLAHYNLLFTPIWQLALLMTPVIGALALVVIYWRLRLVWTGAALLSAMVVVWCFATPYGHANDLLLYIPAILPGLLILARLGTVAARWRALVGRGVTLAAMALLWYGGFLLFLSFHRNPIALYGVASAAPLLLLVMYIIAEPVFHRRPLPHMGTSAESLTETEPTLVETTLTGVASIAQERHS